MDANDTNTITAQTVEEELKKLKIIDDYDPDEYEHVKTRLHCGILVFLSLE
jgi:hypothetical protein